MEKAILDFLKDNTLTMFNKTEDGFILTGYYYTKGSKGIRVCNPVSIAYDMQGNRVNSW